MGRFLIMRYRSSQSGYGYFWFNSIVQNSIAFVQGDKDLQEALTDIIKPQLKVQALHTQAVLQGHLLNRNATIESVYLRGLSKTSLPALVVTTCRNGKCIKSYIKGEIDGRTSSRPQEIRYRVDYK